MPPSAKTIHWYPGHMVRAMRRLAEDLRIIDIVVEVVDARVPESGRNPLLAEQAKQRSRLLVLSRTDLANPDETALWLGRLQRNELACELDAGSRASFTRLRTLLAQVGAQHNGTRTIVLGIPNAGKSTVINGLVGRAVARTEDRAGVTRAAQWFRVQPDGSASMQLLMDTAGILPPKIDTDEARWKLALVGAVPRARYDPEDVVAHFTAWASQNGYAQVPDLETYAQARGFVRHGGALDTHNAAWAYIKDFNEARFGRITLERAP